MVCGLLSKWCRAHVCLVEVGGTANIFVSLASGRNTLSRVFLRFSSPEVTIYSARGLVQGGYISMRWRSIITVLSGDNLGAIFSEEGVLVNEMKSDQLIQFFLPHSEAISRDYVVCFSYSLIAHM